VSEGGLSALIEMIQAELNLDINDRQHQTRFCFKYHVPGGFNQLNEDLTDVFPVRTGLLVKENPNP
jgi:hypothetical protein